MHPDCRALNAKPFVLSYARKVRLIVRALSNLLSQVQNPDTVIGDVGTFCLSFENGYRGQDRTSACWDPKSFGIFAASVQRDPPGGRTSN